MSSSGVLCHRAPRRRRARPAAAGIRQSPAELWLSPGATDQLGCNTSGAERSVSWYRERPDGALLHVYQSFQESPPQGRYSGTRERRRVFSFRISSVSPGPFTRFLVFFFFFFFNFPLPAASSY
uniref:Immunoglobulin V-set domain-containing protein n=1 Tax=Apteryx owenii TaxID=8824 RepID=A0A8B9S9C6_APTOW